MITFVFPVYNEEQSIAKLVEEMFRVREKIDDDVEMLFINDGSKDNTERILLNYAKEHSSIKVISFSRNFGHQIALTAGLDYARGDAVVVMDSDLQDPPMVALELIEKWKGGYEIVYAKRRSRKDGFLKKLTAWGFYRTLRTLSSIDIPEDTGDFRLLDRKVVDTLKQFRESSRFMRGLTSYVGFKQTAVLFDRNERFAGETKYPWRKMAKFAWDGITSFSMIPLRISTYLGFFVAILSLIGIGYALFMKLFFPDITVTGWTLMIIAIFFIGGTQMVVLGIMGEYIGRIYTEVRNRPLYIVKQTTNIDAH
ncbi:glycosyltransferase family 2 protein [candidate division WWE3 bacterium]|nr:glycosyltransferase family 2 protein [candidate division WWE3 bacterium]